MSALELARRALAAAGDGAEVVVQSERSGMARFAASEVHQPTLVEDDVVQVRIELADGRAGVAATNVVDDAGLRAVAGRARAAAEAAPPDPEAPGLAGPAEAPPVDGCDEATAALAPAELARTADAAIAASPLPLYGYFTSGVVEIAVASAAGAALEQRLTDATLTLLAATDEISGWASRSSWQAGEIDVGGCAREAVEKAERTRGAGSLAPGTYRAVLEPYALAELISYFGWSSFGGLSLLEERSYLTGRLGTRVFDERISIVDDALDPRGLPSAFDFEGTPHRPVQLVEAGVARSVVWDRATARRGGAESTGHALPPLERRFGPSPTTLVVAGGEAESIDELAEAIGDGVYVTRVHYLGIANDREGLLTGMTRDGTFRIRDGRVAEPLVNHRFTLSMPALLRDVLGLTREQVAVNLSEFYESRSFAAVVPALASASFAITGAGSSPGL